MQKDFILLIMNCKKYALKAQYQRVTWLPLIPSFLSYYHVVGDETLDAPYRFDEERRMLWVKVPDDYNSLPKKVIASYAALESSFSFKYVWKTDDDQILVNPKFLNVLFGILTLRQNIHYGGFVIDVKQNHLSKYHVIHPELPPNLPILQTKYCSGRFYFLSREAVQYLLSRRSDIEKEYFEDYAIGYYLHPRFKETMRHIETNAYFTDIELSDFPTWIESQYEKNDISSCATSTDKST